MLYHVANLDRGLAEIARVLRPGGAVIAVTNSLRHLSELWELMQYSPAFDFNRENGEEHLRRFFAQVERHDMEIEVTVRERTTLDAYRRSMQVETAPLTDVPLPFVTFSRPTIFFATK
jgi:ubiquinone/menaquinone biosynthesis C-methylase UbiE